MLSCDDSIVRPFAVAHVKKKSCSGHKNPLTRIVSARAWIPMNHCQFYFFWFFTIIPVTCTVFRCQRRHSLSFSVGQIERLRHNKRDVLRTTHANWLFCPIYGEQNHLNCMRFAKCWVSRTDHSVCTRSIDNGCWHPNDRKHCFALIIIVIGECRKMLYTTMGTNQRYTAAYDTSTPPPHAHTLRIHSKWAIKIWKEKWFTHHIRCLHWHVSSWRSHMRVYIANKYAKKFVISVANKPKSKQHTFPLHILERPIDAFLLFSRFFYSKLCDVVRSNRPVAYPLVPQALSQY